MKMPARGWIGVLAAAVIASGVVALAPPAAAVLCAVSDDVPRALKNRPVVLVHGWNSDTEAMQGTEAGLEQRLNGGNAKNKMLFLRFGYAPYSAEWPSSANVSQCLGDYLLAASAAYKAGGGDGKVLAVGHSMGGIAIRFASARPGVANALGGVVTLGTPHAGSPWGGTAFASVFENAGSKLAGFRMPVPANGTSGGDCLAEPARRGASCAPPPYLPQGVPISTIGTQITIHRELFNLPLVKGPTADVSLFGDGIVPEASANAYTSTGPTKEVGYPIKQNPRRIGCDYDTAYMWSLLPTAQVQTAMDLTALSALRSGKASAALAELTAYAFRTPCFHTNLTSNPEVLDPAAIALRNYDTALRAPAAVAMTATAIGGVRVGTPAADAEAALRSVLGRPDRVYSSQSCTLISNGGTDRQITWGALTVIMHGDQGEPLRLAYWAVQRGATPVPLSFANGGDPGRRAATLLKSVPGWEEKVFPTLPGDTPGRVILMDKGLSYVLSAASPSGTIESVDNNQPGCE